MQPKNIPVPLFSQSAAVPGSNNVQELLAKCIVVATKPTLPALNAFGNKRKANNEPELQNESKYCKMCSNPKLSSNYGFCGVHRKKTYAQLDDLLQQSRKRKLKKVKPASAHVSVSMRMKDLQPATSSSMRMVSMLRPPPAPLFSSMAAPLPFVSPFQRMLQPPAPPPLPAPLSSSMAATLYAASPPFVPRFQRILLVPDWCRLQAEKCMLVNAQKPSVHIAREIASNLFARAGKCTPR